MPRPMQRWWNKHTGEPTMVLAVVQETVKRPHALGQAPDGRFLFGAYRPVEQTTVRYVGCSPPGFDDRHVGGHNVETFLRHWSPIPPTSG
jgi:hypothetical protein